jgi:siroheme synthase (precorrin-2 oxidase/ferrochelatase)
MCANFFPKIFEPSPIIIGISTVTGSLAFAYIFLTGLFQILLKEK